MNKDPLLHIKDLKVSFRHGTIHAVRGIDIKLVKGETLTLIGESGSGKTVAAQSILRLLPYNSTQTTGEIFFNGQDLLKLPLNQIQQVRGNKIGMIFQNPMTSLDPMMRIGAQIAEGILFHEKTSRKVARERSLDLLHKVGIADPGIRIDQYPHQLSGGMRQRVMIAIALSNNPEILIADEPTTALDITVQAQILELLKNMQRLYGLSILFITHDLGVAARISDRIYVMKDGLIVEEGHVDEIFYRPKHPYTRELLTVKKHFSLKENEAKVCDE